MTRALILAAGQGTRLRPLTEDRPKCLVSLLGKTLLERQIAVLEQAGVTDIHVVAGYRADQIQAVAESCSINERYASTNMVATLFSAQGYFPQQGDLLICYGDIVYQVENLRALLSGSDEIDLMIDSHWRQYWELRLEDPLEDAETLVLDDAGFVTELGKKPRSFDYIQGQYTGLIKIRQDKITELIDVYHDLDRAAVYDGQDFDNMYMTGFLQFLIDQGWKAKACIVQNGWLEVDSVEDLRLYEELAAAGKLDRFCVLD